MAKSISQEMPAFGLLGQSELRVIQGVFKSSSRSGSSNRSHGSKDYVVNPQSWGRFVVIRGGVPDPPNPTQ